LYNPWVLSSRMPYRGAMACLLFSVGLASSTARARGVSEFEFRVDLARGTSTRISAWTWPYLDEPIRPGSPELWWRPIDGAPLAISVRAEDGPCPALVLSADHRERLRLPHPAGRGQLVWHALEGDLLVIAWRGSNGRSDETQLSGPEQYSGVDLARGTIVWMRTSGERTERALPAGGGRILVYGPDHFAAMDAASGRVLWQLPRSDAAVDPLPEVCPIAPSRWLVIATEMRAVDESGHVEWTVPVGVRQKSVCRVSGGRAFVAVEARTSSSRHEVAVIALDVASGHVDWQTRVEGPLGELALAGGGLALSAASGLTRLDPTDGHIAWKLDGFGSDVQVLRDGDLFLPGRCARVDAAKGVVRWRLGEPCVRVGETLLLTVKLDNRWGRAPCRVSLRQYAFADRHLVREDVVQQYADYADSGGAWVSVGAAPDGFAYVHTSWTILD
jgi:hypothetical protein